MRLAPTHAPTRRNPVLAEDLHTIDAEKIKDIQIVRTVVGGSTAHQA